MSGQIDEGQTDERADKQVGKIMSSSSLARQMHCVCVSSRCMCVYMLCLITADTKFVTVYLTVYDCVNTATAVVTKRSQFSRQQSRETLPFSLPCTLHWDVRRGLLCVFERVLGGALVQGCRVVVQHSQMLNFLWSFRVGELQLIIRRLAWTTTWQFCVKFHLWLCSSCKIGRCVCMWSVGWNENKRCPRNSSCIKKKLENDVTGDGISVPTTE